MNTLVFIFLMDFGPCWSHVHCNIVPKLKTIGTFNKELAANILNDIMELQWSVHNEEKKYLGKPGRNERLQQKMWRDSMMLINLQL